MSFHVMLNKRTVLKCYTLKAEHFLLYTVVMLMSHSEKGRSLLPSWALSMHWGWVLWPLVITVVTNWKNTPSKLMESCLSGKKQSKVRCNIRSFSEFPLNKQSWSSGNRWGFREVSGILFISFSICWRNTPPSPCLPLNFTSNFH